MSRRSRCVDIIGTLDFSRPAILRVASRLGSGSRRPLWTYGATGIGLYALGLLGGVQTNEEEDLPGCWMQPGKY
ncbi:MAG: hypothetical protein ACI9BW_004447 [Gammaproteobacteria bacterium]|jgi:hypothetical protein